MCFNYIYNIIIISIFIYNYFFLILKENYEEYYDEECLKYWNSYKKKNFAINLLKNIAKKMLNDLIIKIINILDRTIKKHW
jgi:hypothetical protein